MQNMAFLLMVFVVVMAVAYQAQGDMWRRAFCNDDGSPSSARPMLLFLLLAVVSCQWDVNGMKAIPPTWENLLYAMLGYAFGTKALSTIKDGISAYQQKKEVDNEPPKV